MKSQILIWLYATLITIAVVIISEFICVLIGMGSDFLVGFMAGVSFVIAYLFLQSRTEVSITKAAEIAEDIQTKNQG